MESGDHKWFDRKLAEITGSITGSDIELALLSAVEAPAVWAEKNISFQYDVSAKTDGNFDLALTPYLKDVLNSWQFDGHIRETTVVAPEQTGKSLSWLIGLLWCMCFKPCLSLVIYPSDELGIKINKEKLEPLMKSIPKLKAELDMPRSQKRDHYDFSNLKCYFSGAGSRVTSQSSKIRIADECDDWTVHEGKVTNLQDLRKRARSFEESIYYKVCTPTTRGGAIWREFEKSSQGYWHLMCQKCRDLTIRSSDVHNLQFNLDAAGDVVRDSIVLVCPKCKHEHREALKKKMNIEGGYKHIYPERIEKHAGFQWGALASQWETLNWLNIAEAQLLAGKSGNRQDQLYFDNSIRGLPYIRRRLDKPTMEMLRQHCDALPGKNTLPGLFLAADTQDDRFYYTITGLDNNENMYLLKYGEVRAFNDLARIKEKGWRGLDMTLSIQDIAGHRTVEAKRFVSTQPKMFAYKGSANQGGRIKYDKEERKLSCRARAFQGDLLYYMYDQTNKDNNYLFFPPDVSDEFLEHLASIQKDNSKKHGDDYENWEFTSKRHDYFDCLKMTLALIEYAKTYLPAKYWLHEPSFAKRKQKIVIRKRQSDRFATAWKS